MAMSTGGRSGVQSEINITPLVDVVLVLLIIFMVATPILQMGLDVEVPPKVEMAAPPPQTDQKQLVITVKRDGVYLNTQKMASLQELRDMIARQMVARPAAERVVFINSEDNLQFERAVQAMDTAHQAGAQKVGFLTAALQKIQSPAVHWLIAAFALGAIIGSFLNVVIHRYPREESVVFPPSRCASCGALIKPYDNVPIFAWLWLRGRCRACRAPFSARYPLVELANALFYVAIYQRTGPTTGFLALAALVSMTIVLIYIDLEIQILPDVIDLPGVAIGLLIGATHLGASYPDLMLSKTLLESVAGAVMGGGVLLAIALAYKLLRKIEGMGLGDVKMMAMIGAVIGWEPLLPTFIIASVTGAVVGLVVASKSGQGMQAAIPFGVFLGLAFLFVLFFGTSFWPAYLDLLLVR